MKTSAPFLTQARQPILIGLAVGLVTALVLWLNPSEGESSSARNETEKSPKRRFQTQSTERLQDLREPAVTFRTDSTLSEKEMIRLLGELPSPLSDDEISLLLSWVVNGEGDQLSNGSRIFVANEVLNLMNSQEEIPRDLVDVLSILAEGKDYPLALRGYALQHMRTMWQKSPIASVREELEDSLWASVDLPESNLQATALLGLHELSDGGGKSLEEATQRHVSTERLTEKAEGFLSDQSVPADLRMVSLRILKERGVAKVGPLVREIIHRDHEPVALKLNAIHALGRFGNSEDIKFLNSIAQKPFHRNAVEKAIANLSSSNPRK